MSYHPPKPSSLPVLPLLLWDTPPGLELALGQEGVPFRHVPDPHPLAFRGGRFVLYDGRRVSAAKVRSRLSAEHVAIDIDDFRKDEALDPFLALIDTRATLARWELPGVDVCERVGRNNKAAIRQRLVDGIRRNVVASGGVWARLSSYPFPYHSAFNFRADLDETHLDDYARFARARRRVDDCCTHFVSTHAYGEHPGVLQDLLRFDTQSHGHFHVIYRDPEANRRNLSRAHDVLVESGFEPLGFAAPHGRWNHGLDRVIEELGYVYSSDFQLGYDDLPFFPWVGDRFSKVLQVPIHPVCEGIFFDAGATRGRAVADHLTSVVRAKIDACEPAFVYGHPERRLARYPEILAALEAEIVGRPLVWRVTLSEFALWWRWRAQRAWSLIDKGEGGFEIQFEEWNAEYPIGLEVVRGSHVARVPVESPRTTLRLDQLAYERRSPRAEIPLPTPILRPLSLRAAVRSALDWETVTPLNELPAASLADRVKRGLRLWKHGREQRERLAS